jgi:hypothetical protein
VQAGEDFSVTYLHGEHLPDEGTGTEADVLGPVPEARSPAR